MIASTPVARWAWGRDSDAADFLFGCLADLLSAHAVLVTHRLVLGDPKIRVSVPESGKPNSLLFEGEFVLPVGRGSVESAELFAREVRSVLRPGRIGSVDASISCSAMRDGEDEEVVEEGAFLLGASAFDDFVTVDLVTFSDTWMRHDLRGNAQPAVYEANAPRLAAGLRDLAEVLGSDTEPEDATYFGRPTETGVENFFGRDGSASDVWASFEIPYRNRVFYHAPAFQEGYRRSADGEVRYIPVRGEHRVLGYLWASDAEGAASFEPRDDAEEAGYKAGLLGLDRLRSAYARGLSPSQALDEVAGVVGAERPRSSDLASLRERASEDPPPTPPPPS
ncbi:hypothetical protein [Streptomyces goshikiensis]|uniref:hypothetical protein n=1 Tax=Streptomyces goshikiensis TaxID=1942 RepID=UPI0036650F70